MGLSFQNLIAERDQHWLTTSIHQQILQEASGDQRQPDGAFHPSAISTPAGQTCDRYLSYTLWALPELRSVDSKLQRVFAVGKDMHIRHQKLIKRMGLLVAEEAPVRLDYPRIRGNADAIISKPYHPEELYVLELKTMRSTLFNPMIRPKDDHVIQTNIYMGGLEIWKAIILYENKDDQVYKVYPVDFDEPSWKEMIERLRRIEDKYNDDVLPPQIEWTGCSYCPFNNICKGKKSSGDDIIRR